MGGAGGAGRGRARVPSRGGIEAAIDFLGGALDNGLAGDPGGGLVGVGVGGVTVLGRAPIFLLPVVVTEILPAFLLLRVSI